MNIFKKIWLWLIGRRIKNTGYELIKISGDDLVHISYSWDKGSGLPEHIDIQTNPDGELLIGPFPRRVWGETLYVDAGKNKVRWFVVKHDN